MSVGTVPLAIHTPMIMPTVISTKTDGSDTWITWNTPFSILLQLKPSLIPTRPVIARPIARSEEHTSELQSLMRISYAVFCLKKKNQQTINQQHNRYKISS